MAVALVGTIGAASQGASGAAVTPAWGAGESRTAGNLLILLVAYQGTSSVPATPTGWSGAVSGVGTTALQVNIFYKVATGADAAPTVPAIVSTVITAQLAEFSGSGSTPDRTNSVSTTGGTLSLTTAAQDTAPGELAVFAVAIAYSAAATKTFTDSMTNGMTAHVTDNAATSTVDHYHFVWGVTTSNAQSDQDTITVTTTKLLEAVGAVASFRLPAAGASVPPPTVVGQAVKRAAFYMSAARRGWKRQGGLLVPEYA